MRLGWLTLALFLGASACASKRSSLPGEDALCVEGRSIACACDDGSPSVRECGANGMYGECNCGELVAGSSAAGVGAGSGAIQGGSGGQSAGSGGSAGSGDPLAGQSGIAGGAGMSTAGTGQAGIGGGGSGQAGTDAAGTGAGGVGSAGVGQAGSDAQPAAPGELYGPCPDSGQCDSGLYCAYGLDEQGDQIRLCTTTCTGFGMGGGRCEQPETGTVQAVCTTAVCLLTDCEGAQCPVGLQCMTTLLPSGQGGMGGTGGFGGTRRITQCIPEQ